MVGVIKARPDEIVHGRVQDDEAPRLAFLYIDHPRHQDSSVPRDEAAGLQDDLATEVAYHLADDIAVAIGMGRLGLVHFVWNPKATAKIHAADRMARGTQFAHQTRNPREGGAERLEIGQLRADMDIDPDDFNAGERRRPGIEWQRLRPGHTEL